MRRHKRGQLRRVVVRAHEQVTLVLVCRVAGRRLGRRRQSLEVELICVSLPMYFRHYVFVVVVSGTCYTFGRNTSQLVKLIRI